MAERVLSRCQDVYHSGCHDKHNCPQWDLIRRFLSPQSGMLQLDQRNLWRCHNSAIVNKYDPFYQSVSYVISDISELRLLDEQTVSTNILHVDLTLLFQTCGGQCQSRVVTEKGHIHCHLPDELGLADCPGTTALPVTQPTASRH